MLSHSKCPECDYIFVLRPGFTYTQVSCPECKHAFCHQCSKVPHKGKTCKEAKDEKENLDAHASTAAAMTEAVVRKCPNPKCNKRFVKEKGCNKMTCPSCKTLSCYICREALDSKEPYKHFCRKPHCQHKSCGKCVLFTDAKEDDRQARREVAQAALLAVQKKDGGANAATLIGGLLSRLKRAKALRLMLHCSVHYFPLNSQLRTKRCSHQMRSHSSSQSKTQPLSFHSSSNSNKKQRKPTVASSHSN